MVPLLSPNSSSLPLVSRKTPTALNFQISSAAAAIAPPLQAFFASLGGRFGRRRRRRIAQAAAQRLHALADGPELRRLRREQRERDAPGFELARDVAARSAARAASASDFSCSAWTSAWQAGQLTADGGMSAPHCRQRACPDSGIGGGKVMGRASERRRGAGAPGRGRERPADGERHRRRELPRFPEADAEDHQAERPFEADHDRQAQDGRGPQDDVEDAHPAGLAFGQERHPAEGDRRIGQDDRQHLVDHAAAPARGPPHAAPDQEADARWR